MVEQRGDQAERLGPGGADDGGNGDSVLDDPDPVPLRRPEREQQVHTTAGELDDMITKLHRIDRLTVLANDQMKPT
jgi:hypothetical protein